MPLEVHFGLVFIILWTGKVMNKTENHEIHWFSDQISLIFQHNMSLREISINLIAIYLFPGLNPDPKTKSADFLCQAHSYDSL